MRVIQVDQSSWFIFVTAEGVNPEDDQEVQEEQDYDADSRIIYMPFFDKFKELQVLFTNPHDKILITFMYPRLVCLWRIVSLWDKAVTCTQSFL